MSRGVRNTTRFRFVLRCRRSEEVLKKTWEVKLGKNAYDWLNQTCTHLKGAANAPHHSSNVHYSQLESQMILTITISLIAYIAKTADAKAQSCDPKTCLSMSEAAALSREEFYFLKHR